MARFSLLCALTIALVFGAGIAYAGPARGPGPEGGYIGPGTGYAYGAAGSNNGHASEIVSIRQALIMKNGTNVTIRGNITRSLGGNKYTVTDSSGTAEVHIGSKAWGGQRVGAADIVLLQGEVKKEKKNTIIDVKHVVKQRRPGAGYGLNQGHGLVGGNIGHASEVVSVRQALTMKNGAHVTIRGVITRNLGGSKYAVTDASGVAEVYIDSKALAGQRIAVSDTVLLQGEVKKDKTRTTIDAKQIVKQQGSGSGFDHSPGPGGNPVRPGPAGQGSSSTRG